MFNVYMSCLASVDSSGIVDINLRFHLSSIHFLINCIIEAKEESGFQTEFTQSNNEPLVGVIGAWLVSTCILRFE